MSRPRGQDQKIRRLLEESSSYDHSQQHGQNHKIEKKQKLLLLGLAQMQQTQLVSWYCNLFYDAFHSAIKIFTSPLLFWVKKNVGGDFGILYPMTQEQQSLCHFPLVSSSSPSYSATQQQVKRSVADKQNHDYPSLRALFLRQISQR